MLTKNEALKKCIDGAKICHKGYRPNNLIYFDGEKFILTNGDVSMDADGPALAHEDGWQIVPEYVDFKTAWRAYEEGKLIQSKDGTIHKRSKEEPIGWFAAQEIRGKWQILEDNQCPV